MDMNSQSSQTTGHALWVAGHAIMAAGGGGFLAWGPLNGRFSLILFLAITTGLVGGWLAYLTRHRRRHLLWGQAALVAAIALLALSQLYRAGFFPPLGESRTANFERLWTAVYHHYPYFEQKGVDWDEVYRRYQPQVAAATSDAAYYDLVGLMLAELNDAHTGLPGAPQADPGCNFALVWEVEGEAVVIAAGGPAVGTGLGVGARILTVDGRSLPDALAQVDPRRRVGSTARQQRARAFEQLLYTPTGASRTITFVTPDGASREATLTCPTEPTGDPAGAAEFWELLQMRQTASIQSRQLPSGLGYIYIPTFGQNKVTEFDAALDALMASPGLILDLRGNGGGNTRYALPIAGRFLDEPVFIGQDHFARRLPHFGWRGWLNFQARPRSPTYDGPLILLIDEGNMSTAELFILALTLNGRAQTVGRQTAGATGNPISFQLVGGRSARFSTADFRLPDGTSLEGMGISPTYPVAWTLTDFHDGRDPDLETAEQHLLSILQP
jgi:carboxyl-terminal processing protease